MTEDPNTMSLSDTFSTEADGLYFNVQVEGDAVVIDTPDETIDNLSQSIIDSAEVPITCNISDVSADDLDETLRSESTDMKLYEMSLMADTTVLDLSGCDITMDVTLSDEVIEEAGCYDPETGYTGMMEVTVQPQGNEPVTKIVSAVELMESDGAVPITLSYSVSDEITSNEATAFSGPMADPVNTSEFYAVTIRKMDTLVLDSETASNPYLSYVIVEEGGDFTIDLNGQTWIRDFTEYPDFDMDSAALANLANPVYQGGAAYHPFAYVFSGGCLKIIDSAGGGKIAAKDLQAVVALRNTNYDLEPPKLIIDCPDSTEIRNDGGHHVIFTEDGTDWGFRLNSMVELHGGTLAGATGTTATGWGGASGIVRPDDRGGGILAGQVDMYGGIVEGCTVTSYGGGICANTVNLYGGIICDNHVGDTFGYGWGGGIFAVCLNMSGGEVSNNHASYAGGGMFTYSLSMKGGTVRNNDCIDANSKNTLHVRGGGGIYIANPTHLSEDWNGLPGTPPDMVVRSDYVDRLDREVLYNAEITGGTIENNISDHTGGGVFINNGSKCYVRGENSVVRIHENRANDILYKYGPANTGGQGFAGGGIYVEHENPDSSNPSTGGFVMIYDSVVTDNTARFGGGISGCASSEIEVFSVDGALVNDNHLTEWPSDWQIDATGMERFSVSVDVYASGYGGVDCRTPYGDPVVWNGFGTIDGSFRPISDISDMPLSFDGPFYLTSSIDPNTIVKAISNMSVIITGNYSGSSGGGVGGNGIIYFGSQFSDSNAIDSLKLVKMIDVPNSLNIDREFDFEIKLMDNGQICRSVLCLFESPGIEADSRILFAGNDGLFHITLKHNESVTFTHLKSGTSYYVEETGLSNTAYDPPDITDTNGTLADGTSAVTGIISGNNAITFTNHPLYGPVMPNTGSSSLVFLYVMACSLIAIAMVSFLMLRYIQRKNRKKK